MLKQKSLGQAIMVSDFVEEVGGMHECDGVKATLYLEHQSDGYFTNDHLITQVQHDINIPTAKVCSFSIMRLDTRRRLMMP